MKIALGGLALISFEQLNPLFDITVYGASQLRRDASLEHVSIEILPLRAHRCANELSDDGRHIERPVQLFDDELAQNEGLFLFATPFELVNHLVYVLTGVQRFED